MICDPAIHPFALQGLEKPGLTKAARHQPTSAPVDQASRGRMLLESHFDLIQQRLRSLSRRGGLPAYEADEFLSWALFKLVENDYRMLTAWEGRSSFSTYLTVVLVNLMRDYRTHVWGRWRPSAVACQQGPEAVWLERLLFRDGLSLDEAIHQIQSAQGVTLSRGEWEEIASRLPRRVERRRVSEEGLHQVAVDGQVESRVEQGELARTATQLRDILLPLLRGLPAESRLLLKLHYREGFSIAVISRLSGKPQKDLYRFRDRCLKSLRRGLEEAGLHAGDVGVLIGSAWELSLDEENAWE
jgi:RNA polymerase sigma factor (sigma-70 family)